MAAPLTIMPFPFHQFFDNNGNPASGYRLFFYEAGTSTKQDVYTSSGGSEAASNPLTLDSAGRPSSPIYLLARAYKVVLAPPGSDDPPTTTVWTADNVYATPPVTVDLDVDATAGAAISANDCVYLSDGSGGRTAGRWYQTDQDTPEYSTQARILGFAVTAATGAADTFTVRRSGRLTGLSGLTAGSLYYVSSTAGAITSTAPANARRVGMADSTTSLVISAEIEEPVKGFIPLDLVDARELSAGATQNAAANGGILASDTTPILQRVNGATDQALRINWAATNVDVITWSFAYPPDLDDTRDLEVHLLCAMSGATNSPTIGVAYFEGVGDSDAGGNTAAVSGTSVQERTVTIAAANVGAAPTFAAVSLTPAAHATDALYLYAIWIEYFPRLYAT